MRRGAGRRARWPRGPLPSRPIIDTARSLRRPDGATIAYRVRPADQPAAGAPPVLLVHGLASNLTRFEEFVETSALGRRHALVRVDLRGHGGSLTRRRIDLETWSDDLAALLDAEAAVPGAPAIVVGHSLGAQVALHLAARHPRAVGALVLIDPVFRAALHGRWWRIARAGPLFALAAALVRGGNALGLHRRRLEPLDLRALDRLAREALASPEAEQAFIERYSSTRADLQHVPLAVYLQDMAEMFRPAPLPRELAVPVLALLSTGATFADAGEMRALLAGPRVTLGAIDCHHWPLTERPLEVRQAIEAWVAGLGA